MAISRLPFRMRSSLSSVIMRKFCSCSTPETSNIASNRSKLNDVHRFIVSKIETSGPITVAEYMNTCLTAPQGYYTGPRAQDAKLLGQQGDFLTAPQISQMFGEFVGLWIISEALNLGYKGSWQYVELGPGAGTLTLDVVNILRRFNHHQNVSVHLVEVSHNMALAQKKLICKQDEQVLDANSCCYLQGETWDGIQVRWYADLKQVPQEFSVFMANEFFDALPIHQFKRDYRGRWREVFVDLDSKDITGCGLRFAVAPTESAALRAFMTKEVAESTRRCWEVSPVSGALIENIAHRLTDNGGTALIVDYGHTGEREETLRGYAEHKLIDVLDKPGECDLTAHVNFDYMKNVVADKAAVFGPVTQGAFLQTLGIDHRLKQLMLEAKDDSVKEYLTQSHKWLTHKNHMGHKFKVMSMFPSVVKERLIETRRPQGFVPM